MLVIFQHEYSKFFIESFTKKVYASSVLEKNLRSSAFKKYRFIVYAVTEEPKLEFIQKIQYLINKKYNKGIYIQFLILSINFKYVYPGVLCYQYDDKFYDFVQCLDLSEVKNDCIMKYQIKNIYDGKLIHTLKFIKTVENKDFILEKIIEFYGSKENSVETVIYLLKIFEAAFAQSDFLLSSLSEYEREKREKYQNKINLIVLTMENGWWKSENIETLMELLNNKTASFEDTFPRYNNLDFYKLNAKFRIMRVFMINYLRILNCLRSIQNREFLTIICNMFEKKRIPRSLEFKAVVIYKLSLLNRLNVNMNNWNFCVKYPKHYSIDKMLI
jgi:hypothetical protein